MGGGLQGRFAVFGRQGGRDWKRSIRAFLFLILTGVRDWDFLFIFVFMGFEMTWMGSLTEGVWFGAMCGFLG